MPRQSDYKPEYADQALSFALLGLTDEQMAESFGVTVVTLRAWRKKQPAFLSALKAGKHAADAKVSRSLYHKALGYEWDEIVPMKVKHVEYDNGKRVSEVELIKMHTVHKIVPPDTTAAIFWLKNRNKENWRERQEVTGADGGPIETNTLTYMPKQLKADYFEQSASTDQAA